MLKSFKSFKSFKGDSNVSSQIWCKSTAILLYRYEENIKKLLNRNFVASHSLSIDSESHSNAFDKKVLLLRLLTLFLALYLASFHRENTDRRPRDEEVPRMALRVLRPKSPHFEE